MLLPLLLVAATAASASHLSYQEETTLLRAGIPQVALFKALTDERIGSKDRELESFVAGDEDSQHLLSSSSSPPKWKAHCFPQPITHFQTTDPSITNETFCQRYWFNPEHYQAGGPVIVLDGGETSGANRLPFLETGILDILARATNGLPVVLEHRYYGESFPYFPHHNLSTDSLRWLNNAEALEDSAEFMRGVEFEGFEGVDLKAGGEDKTKWIYYGGSYAGARAAHMRKLYPDLVFGGIASSAVTRAEIFYSDYMDAIRQWAPQDCMAHVQASILIVDDHLDHPHTAKKIKKLFGLEALEDDDFASVISSPLSAWQSRNWDPKIGSTKFYEFCDALGAESRHVGKGKHSKEKREWEVLENYASWIKKHEIKKCPEDGTDALLKRKKGKIDIEECFGTHNATKFQDISAEGNPWRAWIFQTCTEWGYYQGAPLTGPRILSNRMTLEYTHKICQQSFPPGNYFQIPTWPNVSVVNDLGGYALEMDRLAFIDGDSDPWRPATPQSDHAIKRNDTVLRPVKMIEDACHHYDENGLANPLEEPPRIQKIHAEMVEFVRSWLREE